MRRPPRLSALIWKWTRPGCLRINAVLEILDTQDLAGCVASGSYLRRFLTQLRFRDAWTSLVALDRGEIAWVHLGLFYLLATRGSDNHLVQVKTCSKSLFQGKDLRWFSPKRGTILINTYMYTKIFGHQYSLILMLCILRALTGQNIEKFFCIFSFHNISRMTR